MSLGIEEIDLTDLEKGLYGLFRHIFITNCQLDKASVTEEELRTLEELDSLEILENLKDVSLELLKFKKENVDTDVAELAEKSEKFESMLQKLEGEVREHISLEHQLRLHSENIQSKLDEAEIELEKCHKQIKEMKGEHDSTSNKQFEDKLLTQIAKVSKSHKENPDRIRKEYESRLTDALQKKDYKIKIIEEENLNLKNRLEEKNKEIESLRNNKTRVIKTHVRVDSVRKRCLEKPDANRRPKTVKRGTIKPPVKKAERNSPIMFAKRNSYVSRQHIRSFSEHNKNILNKRAPSR